jgi:hypothetical protein
MPTPILRTIGGMWYEFPLGKKLGEDGTGVLWVVIYILGIIFIAPGELFKANLLAIAFAVPLVGSRFASTACLWAFGAVLAYRYPRLFYAVCAAVWLTFVVINWKRRTSEPATEQGAL